MSKINEFISGSFRELRHVVWPTRAETTKYFGFILVFMILFGFYLQAFDLLFSKLLIFIKG